MILSTIGATNVVGAALDVSVLKPEFENDEDWMLVNSGESICSKYVVPFGVYISLYWEGAPPNSPNCTDGESGIFP